ncbi:MAGE [Drosophila busckii]|uniref:MAGE n=1 Tax=Drosophila busckii TaxID=30019 RepID=A0A0M5JCK1_DROBS|nr:non-structural maintenance of chromosomes element 3 homolog [Drosophila busckii]ALC46668.1 MAGE [Drosophila busckii]
MAEEEQRIDSRVSIMVNFILCHSANKVPIKYSDLSSIVDGKHEVNKRLPFVTELLEQRYGMKLVQLEGAGKRYITVAEAPVCSIHELTTNQRPQFTLISIVLTYIFLRSNRLEEEKLYNMLDEMGVNVQEEHGYFGDNIRKLIEDTFVKQQYLKRERSQLSSNDDPKNYYSWGQRAKLEFTYENIVQFACKLLDKDEEFFEQHLMTAYAADNPELMYQQSMSTSVNDNSNIG